MKKSLLGQAALTVAAGVLVFATGCSHPLEIKNLNELRPRELNPLKREVSVGVVSAAADKDSEQLVRAIGVGLRKHTQVMYPYAKGSDTPADVVAKISIQPEYKGSWANFFINFPGFLIWTPAWNGYAYTIDYKIDVLLSRESDNEKIDSWTTPVTLKLRQSDISRTWAAEISWFEVGVFAFVSGLIYTGYDQDVTPMAIEKAEVPLGDFVAQEIVNRLNKSSMSPAPGSGANPYAAPAAPAAPAATSAPAAVAAPAPVMAAPVPAYERPAVAAPAAAAPFAPAIGGSARLLEGGALRSRPTPDAAAVTTDTSVVFQLSSNMRNASGSWWYGKSARYSGWIQERDLTAAP